MAPVVDSHVHIFPSLDEASGFGSQAEHRWFLQLYMATHGEPVRRLRDHAQVHQQTLHDGRLDTPSSLKEVDFRVGRCGRFEWTADGEDVYLQFFPPSLQTMASPPELMLQQMARAGVDRAVLQNARLYGRLNEFFAAAVRAYPDRFIGLADVDEAQAHTPAQLDKLRHAIRELGLRGLYYANRALITASYARMFDDALRRLLGGGARAGHSGVLGDRRRAASKQPRSPAAGDRSTEPLGRALADDTRGMDARLRAGAAGADAL